MKAINQLVKKLKNYVTHFDWLDPFSIDKRKYEKYEKELMDLIEDEANTKESDVSNSDCSEGERKFEIPFIEEYLDYNGISFQIIDDQKSFMGCLEIFEKRQNENLGSLIIDNRKGNNIYIVNSRTDCYPFLGLNEYGQITTRGLLGKNESNGLDVTSIGEEIVVIFGDKGVMDHFSFNWSGKWCNQFRTPIFREVCNDAFYELHNPNPIRAKEHFDLGNAYYLGIGVKQDYVKAVETLTFACKNGHIEAFNNLGLCFEYGKGVRRVDNQFAFECYKKAAESGSTPAMNNLGNCYYKGLGTKQNYELAVSWYMKAMENGNSSVQFNLGNCYRDGNGVAKDHTKAAEWYAKAAKQGDSGAQYELGRCYSNHQGVEQDFLIAIDWFRKAAEQGHEGAQYILGAHYHSGVQIPKDLKEAERWYELAAKGGHFQAKEALIRLRHEMETKDNFSNEPLKMIVPFRFKEIVNNYVLKLDVDGVEVKGKITVLEEFYIKVEITEPFVNWVNSSCITGPAKMATSHNFFNTYESVGKRLLLNSYSKLQMIDESIDRIVRLYDDMICEQAVAQQMEDREIGKSIESKLEDWFFKTIFTSSVTGLVASHVYDRERIYNILNLYKKEGKKNYVLKDCQFLEK